MLHESLHEWFDLMLYLFPEQQVQLLLDKLNSVILYEYLPRNTMNQESLS